MGLHGCHLGNAAVKTLPLDNTEFDFRHIEPAPVLGCVVDFKSFRQAPGHLRLEGFIE